MTLHPQGWRPKSWFRRTSPPRKTSNGGDGPASPDNSKGNKEVQVFPASREELAETATGVSQGKPPEGTACVFMPSSSYKLVVRLFLTECFDLTTRAILDTGSGPTLISRQLLPDDTPLQPLGEWASMFHDVNGGAGCPRGCPSHRGGGRPQDPLGGPRSPRHPVPWHNGRPLGVPLSRTAG